MSSELIPTDAVRAIQAGVETVTIDVRGDEFATRPVFLPPAEPVPSVPVVLHTLDAFAEFASDQQSKMADADFLVIHVESPTSVLLLGDIRTDGGRPVYAKALCEREPFEFGAYLEQADFVIGAQVGFIDDDERKRLLSLVGTIKSSKVLEASDDGVTQTVMARKGITREAEVNVRNPFDLRPYRTFSEVEQPVSPFILRLQAQDDELPEAGLWACDGEAWRLDAVKNVEAHLVEVLKPAANGATIPVFA